MSVVEDSRVVVTMKTPILPRGMSVSLPASLSVDETIEQILEGRPQEDDEEVRRILDQLELELGAGRCDILAVRGDGQVEVINGARRLGELAETRQAYSGPPGRIETFQAVALEVQAYAPVG